MWQHLAYSAQLREKRRAVCDALADVEVDDIVAAPYETQYRNWGKYVVGDGLLGAYAPRSHQIVSTIGCTVVEPVIDQVATTMAGLLRRTGLRAYEERTGRGQLRYVVVRSDGMRALVGLVVTRATDNEPLQRVARVVRQRVPQVAGVIRIDNDSTGGTLLTPHQRTLSGRTTIRERVGSIDLEVDISAFFQINRAQAARLYAAIARCCDADQGPRVVDVYCGVGGIALTLAQRGAHVLGIERHPGAVMTARAAAARNQIDAQFEVAPARALGHLGRDADVIVVNPPRKGLDHETRQALADVAPRRLVYVSCNPTTLARDLAFLQGNGYGITRVLPFDLMPGTAQVETVAVCQRT